MNFDKNKIKNIKLVIWDLDDTFWRGTLSDNENVVEIKDNTKIVKMLTERGIVNSVCSKNDESQAKNKLKEFGILDYFVFLSIEWTSKAQRVKNIIEDMALREENVLFIDDNLSNLAEVEFVCKKIMTAMPDSINILKANINKIGKIDTDLSRLKQYKVLEKKRRAVKNFESNEDFLNNSGICVAFYHNTMDYADRIYELLTRSNQLNFTKKRISKAELDSIIASDKYDTAAIFVKDNYGDYGLAGFYALTNGILEHFFFSCRVLGMGIEQYVYYTLNCPIIEIISPVSAEISTNKAKPQYIKEVLISDFLKDTKKELKQINEKILLKGPCDLQVMRAYLNAQNIDLEFNFFDNSGNQVDFYNHSAYVLEQATNTNELQHVISKYGFLSKEIPITQMFSGEYDVVCYSPLMDATLAVYKHKETGILIPFGIYTMPITDIKYHNDYIDKKVMTARCNFTREDLLAFSNDFEKYNYSPQNISSNIKKIVEMVLNKNPNTTIVILLLSELEYKKESEINYFKNKHLIHKEINNHLKEALKDIKSVKFIDVNKYIHSQSDYGDNNNHYSKLIYYNIAKDFVKILRDSGVSHIRKKNIFEYMYYNFKKYMYSTKIYLWISATKLYKFILGNQK